MQRTTFRRSQRHGLAPLELVMWLPIFLLVGALIVNLGTMQTWRLRGEVAARNAAWNARWPHRDLAMIPDLRAWRGVSNRYTLEASPPELDPAALNHPAIRGPLPAMPVRPLLDPARLPVLLGHGHVARPLPMLRNSAPYDSGDIRHPLLDGTWTVEQMPWASNVRRRTKDLYVFPVDSPPAGDP